MKKIIRSLMSSFIACLLISSFNSYAQELTCDYDMVAINNSSHGCNDGGINTTLPSNIYPSLAHDVYYNGSFIATVALGGFAGTTFFSTVFFDGHGLGTWEYYAHYLDAGGNLVSCNYHKVIVSEPACDLTIIGFTSANGTACSTGQLTGTVSGNFCSGWTNTIYSGSFSGPIVYTNSGSATPAPFTVSNLPTGVYYARINDASCLNEYNTPLNSCPKVTSGFGASGITASKATVAWNVIACALSYQVQYRKVGTTTWTKKATNGNVGSKLLNGLLASTTYEWQVRSKCYLVPAIWSAWSAKNSFNTTAFKTIAENENNPGIENPSLQLFPNPSRDQLTVQVETNALNVHLQILNLSGQVIWKNDVSSPAAIYTEEINISAFPAGLYLLQVKTEHGVGCQRFEKE